MIPIKPMLAVSGRVFSGKDWIFEPKIDGTRCIAHISGGKVELQNRRSRSITNRFPEVTVALQQAAKGDCILDGEMAVFSKGVPSFSSLALRDQQVKSLRIEYLARAVPASYIVFDILFDGQKSLMSLPLLERKAVLKERVQENDFVTVIDYLEENGEAYFKAALSMGLEGILAKRAASAYHPGIRSPDWIKIKKRLTVDLVVGGFIPGNGERSPFFGGLLLGAYESGNLIFMGRVGSGFSFKELEWISGKFNVIEEPPFSNPPSLRGAKWLKPELVVEVEALEVSKRRHLRAPVYLRTRDDKLPEECTIDQLPLSG